MEGCRFCEIINGKRENEQLIFENEQFIVVTDRYRKTSVGSICFVIPKKHRRNILKLTELECKELLSITKMISRSIQKAYQSKGVRIWTAINKEAGQSIFHCHIHILPCNSFYDRLIADFPGIYDSIRRITSRRALSKSLNRKRAEKLRFEINNYEHHSKKILD